MAGKKNKQKKAQHQPDAQEEKKNEQDVMRQLFYNNGGSNSHRLADFEDDFEENVELAEDHNAEEIRGFNKNNNVQHQR